MLHWTLFFPLGCCGLWLLRREEIGQLILGICLIGTLIHMATYGGPNYRAPYEMLLSIPAAVAIQSVAMRFRIPAG